MGETRPVPSQRWADPGLAAQRGERVRRGGRAPIGVKGVPLGLVGARAPLVDGIHPAAPGDGHCDRHARQVGVGMQPGRCADDGSTSRSRIARSSLQPAVGISIKRRLSGRGADPRWSHSPAGQRNAGLVLSCFVRPFLGLIRRAPASGSASSPRPLRPPRRHRTGPSIPGQPLDIPRHAAPMQGQDVSPFPTPH